jgi:hypothetical protein
MNLPARVNVGSVENEPSIPSTTNGNAAMVSEY